MALNFTLYRVEMLKSNKVTLFVKIVYNVYANKESSSLFCCLYKCTDPIKVSIEYGIVCL